LQRFHFCLEKQAILYALGVTNESFHGLIMYIFCSDVSEKTVNFFYLQITFCTLYCELKNKLILNLQHRFAHGKQRKIIREVTYNICYVAHREQLWSFQTMLTLCKESRWPKDFIHFGAAAGFFTSVNYLTVLQGSFSAKNFSRSKRSSY
jgi:hypothetical protein